MKTPNSTKMNPTKQHMIRIALSMMLKYSWESQMLGVKRLGVRGALPDLGGACSYLLSIRVIYENA